MILDKNGKEINKMLASVNDTLSSNQPAIYSPDQNRRGLTVYTLSQLFSITGRAKDGNRISGFYDQSIFYLNYDERISIFRLCAPVHSVVSSRMNVISNMDFDIVADKVQEDKIYDQLKIRKSIYDDYSKSTDMRYVIAAGVLAKDIKATLTDILPDMSNFDKSLLRWHKKIQNQNVDKGNDIKNWLMQPNVNDRFEEFIKKVVFDLMIHGSISIYKEVIDQRLENFYVLPGGTTMPLRNKWIGGANCYAQITNNVEEPLIYYDDEIAYANYMPTSARAYGLIPLEALVNQVAENLLFSRLMADQADGTKMPEKMVIIADSSPFGDLDRPQSIPIVPEEQKRIEQKLNTPKKNAIMTFSGNKVEVVDLSRENTMQIQMMREKDLMNIVGMVFQATPMEMNLSGSEDTSGRATSKDQREIYHSRGVLPIVKIIESLINRNILPFRYGSGWKIDYKSEKNEIEEMELLQRKMSTGLFSVNEVRKTDLNLDPFSDEQFEKPAGATQQPNGSQTNPFNFQNME